MCSSVEDRNRKLIVTMLEDLWWLDVVDGRVVGEKADGLCSGSGGFM